MILETIALTLAAIHFGVPLAYYWYAKSRWLPKPWEIRTDPKYLPKVSIIIPTYMGAKWIAQRLDNIYDQDYPRDKIEIIVIDSNSPDGTAEIAKKWIADHGDINTKLINEPVRRGKLSAVLEGLKYVSPLSEIIVFTDDDCLWSKDALRNVVKYFADPVIGAVTGSIKYLDDNGSENEYRMYYNMVRIAESKWWSTPIANGPLLAIRKCIIDKLGLPIFPGADDSAFASYIAFAGYRAIQVDDAWVYEPKVNAQLVRMIRRAIHLTNYFLKLKRYAKKQHVYKKAPFDHIWFIESFLHLANPWILATSALLLVLGATMCSLISVTFLALGIGLLIASREFRMWIKNQAILLVAHLLSFSRRKNVWRR